MMLYAKMWPLISKFCMLLVSYELTPFASADFSPNRISGTNPTFESLIMASLNAVTTERVQSKLPLAASSERRSGFTVRPGISPGEERSSLELASAKIRLKSPFSVSTIGKAMTIVHQTTKHVTTKRKSPEDRRKSTAIDQTIHSQKTVDTTRDPETSRSGIVTEKSSTSQSINPTKGTNGTVVETNTATLPSSSTLICCITSRKMTDTNTPANTTQIASNKTNDQKRSKNLHLTAHAPVIIVTSTLTLIILVTVFTSAYKIWMRRKINKGGLYFDLNTEVNSAS